MTQQQAFDTAFWLAKMRYADGIGGRLEVFRQTGILDRVLDSATEIQRAVQEIKSICPAHISIAPKLLVREMMQVALPGNGWYEYYQQAVNTCPFGDEGLFICNLVRCPHGVEQIGRILLAISRSDLEALKVAWVDMDESIHWRHKHEDTLRDLIIHATCTSFDLEVFEYLNERVRFCYSSLVMNAYWHRSIRQAQPQLLQAVMKADGSIGQQFNPWNDRHILRLAVKACRGVSDLESPVYQILTLLVQISRSREAFSVCEFGEMISDPQARGIIIWCLGQPIRNVLEPYQVIAQAHATNDSELLILAMDSFQISTSDLTEWCDQQGDQFDSSWFGTVLKAKSARSSLE